MRGLTSWCTTLAAALAFVGLASGDAHADVLYSVANLGPASPSAAYLSGQSQLDPSGNYVGLLNASQQAAFQQGSFDVYAHPNTSTAGSGIFYLSSGGDIVDTNPLANPNYIFGSSLITSNNVGMSIGTGSEFDPVGAEGPPSPQLVIFTSDPHSVTYPNPQIPWETTTAQSPGYLNIVWTRETLNTLQYVGQVAGINDHGNLALTEYTYPGPSYTLVMTPHLFTGTGDVSLGTLGGTNGVANALNNSNQVVGWSQLASGAQHAFLYSNGSMQDLNLLIPPLSGITLTSAVGIDSAGDIVAYGTNAAGQMNEYYLTVLEVPAPEPGTLAIMSLMITAVAGRAFYAHSRSRESSR